MNVDQLVGRMSDREKSDYYRTQEVLKDSMDAQKKKSEKEHSDSLSQTEDNLMGKAEKHLYGRMTGVQLQKSHSELDQYSKGIS